MAKALSEHGPHTAKLQGIVLIATYDITLKITMTKELCAQPLRLVWLIVNTKTELEKDIEYRCIKNLSGFKGVTSDYRS